MAARFTSTKRSVLFSHIQDGAGLFWKKVKKSDEGFGGIYNLGIRLGPES